MQKTADELRISDWSSDVCSSDLIQVIGDRQPQAGLGAIPVMMGRHFAFDCEIPSPPLRPCAQPSIARLALIEASAAKTAARESPPVVVDRRGVHEHVNAQIPTAINRAVIGQAAVAGYLKLSLVVDFPFALQPAGIQVFGIPRVSATAEPLGL